VEGADAHLDVLLTRVAAAAGGSAAAEQAKCVFYGIKGRNDAGAIDWPLPERQHSMFHLEHIMLSPLNARYTCTCAAEFVQHEHKCAGSQQCLTELIDHC